MHKETLDSLYDHSVILLLLNITSFLSLSRTKIQQHNLTGVVVMIADWSVLQGGGSHVTLVFYRILISEFSQIPHKEKLVTS